MRPRRLLLLTLAAALIGAAPASAKTVWLCRPGLRPDPCTPGLSTTVYTPALRRVGVIHPRQVPRPAIDCFYVYPTVSDQVAGNANLQIDPEERSIALYQAARYSQYCRVFAPMYRQVTVPALFNPSLNPNRGLPLTDVEQAFRTYLRHFNHGRGFVLIGHSQGSFVLRSLITKDVDRNRSVRRRLVSAILLGGNVLVKRGSGIGGDFKHIPACRSNRQLGCVIAFSTFNAPVPADSFFGRTTMPGMAILCTNPAALGGGVGRVDPIFPSKPFAPNTLIAGAIKLLKVTLPMPRTVWVSAPGAYRAHCSSAGGAHVLEVAPLGGAPTATPSPNAGWGLHLLDANIALGNLVQIVRAEAAAFAGR